MTKSVFHAPWDGRFVAPKTLEVRLSDGGTRVLAGDQVFLNMGTHPAVPNVPGLEAARQLTHIEALELDHLPRQLIVLGAGYVGLELAQADRRCGSRVTVIERGPQLMSREDADVADEMQRILSSEGVQFLPAAEVLSVRGRSGEQVNVVARTPAGERRSKAATSWSRQGGFRTLPGSASTRPGSHWMIAVTFASMGGWRRPRPMCGRSESVPAARCLRTYPSTNVRGLLFTVQNALPLLWTGSSVILTGSIVSIKGFAACSVCNASKAAVRAFARTWIVDLKGRDIRVNVLSPGYTAAPGLSHFMTDEEKASTVASVLLGRIGVPDDLGKAAVFLASDDSAYITGIEPFVDGGVAQI